MTSIESCQRRAWFETGTSAGSARPILRRAARSFGKIVALVALLGAGLMLAALLVPEKPATPAAPSPAADEWVEVNRPIHLFGLSGTDFAKLPLDYAAQRLGGNDGRRDILTFGDPHGDRAWLRLSFYRVGANAAPRAVLADELASIGRDGGLYVSRLSSPTPLSTRFGPFEATDLRLLADRTSTPCLGFRNRPDPNPGLRIAGFVCGTVDRPIDRDLLGCVVDRIDLLSAGDDTALQDLFVAAERRRGWACAPSPLTSAGSRTTWLDANSAAPALKGMTRPGRQMVNRE